MFASNVLGAKRVQLLNEMVPNIKRVALLMNPDNANAQTEQADAQAGAALDVLHPKRQHSLLKQLTKRRRHAPIDAFLLRVEPARLPQLLP